MLETSLEGGGKSPKELLLKDKGRSPGEEKSQRYKLK